MNNKYTSIIIDSDPNAIDFLKARLGILFPNISIINTSISWKDAIDLINRKGYDIIFADISLAGKKTLKALQMIPELESELIFVASHAEHTLDAFALAATGYILKPLIDMQLITATQNAIRRIDYKRKAHLLDKNNEASLHNKIGIHNNKGIDYIDISKILYIQANNKCTLVITENGSIVSSYNIGVFKNLLTKDLPFYEVHRSYIINLNHVRRYESTGSVIMPDNKEIPVSRNEREALMKFFIRATRSTLS